MAYVPAATDFKPPRNTKNARSQLKRVVQRFKQIDILRAVAVFLVMGRHMNGCPPEHGAFFQRLTTIWIEGGWIGVDLFFVLSGFLVSGLLFREHEKFGHINVGQFLIRRAFKIYPPFWCLIGITALRSILQHKDLPLPGVASELLFLQNYIPGLWTHTWSLAVEEHFYLLLAFAFFLLVRRGSSDPFAVIPVAFGIVAASCLALRVVVDARAPFEHMTDFFPTHLRLDSLFFGVLLSYAFHRHPAPFLSVARRFRYALFGGGTLLLIPPFCLPLVETPFLRTFGLTLLYLGSGCFLVAVLGSPQPKSGIARALAYVGSHSYSIYLWHMAMATWGTVAMSRLLGANYNWFAYAFFYFAGSIAIGIGLTKCIEIPTLRLRDRLFPSRGTPLRSGEVRLN